MTYASKSISSPVGTLTLVASDAGLAAILWPNDRPGRVRLGPTADNPRHPVVQEAEAQLAAYFGGTRTCFDMPFDMVGTEFQKRVWSALLTIPFGETRSYGALAAQIGAPKASRAVGAANARNPLSIMVPCHRVIGASGALTGFAGGLDIKRALLALEGQASFSIAS